PDAGEVLALAVHPQLRAVLIASARYLAAVFPASARYLAEVPLHRLPGTAGGDAHGLVVVAGRAAGGEGVAEPEAVLGGDAVGDVGERGGALVRGDHQVGVVGVVAHHVLRRVDAPAAPAHPPRVRDVGDVERAADERAVAGHALGEPRLPVGRVGQPLADDPALGAHRDDHRVLNHLRLYQAQDLGAEVLPAVGPAQPAAGHPAEP